MAAGTNSQPGQHVARLCWQRFGDKILLGFKHTLRQGLRGVGVLLSRAGGGAYTADEAAMRQKPAAHS
jgi:hypothetical protein